MSKPTISTGTIDLPKGKQDSSGHAEPVSPKTDACHIVILADFSGRDHRGLNSVSELKHRRIIEIDRDNFEQVFAGLDVTLDIPLADSAIEFDELDDLHPDYLYKRVPVFDRLKSLRRRLKNNSTFAEAAAEVQRWTEHPESNDSSADHKSKEDHPSTLNEPSSLLDQLLAQPVSRQTSEGFDVKKLVREIMSPYVVPGPDPRQKEMLAAVDEASSELMRKILHNSDFQKTEASWRSLYMLTKRLDTDSQLKIFIIDVSLQEVTEDARDWLQRQQSRAEKADKVSGGALKKLLLEDRATMGRDPFAIMLADYQFSDELPHVEALNYLADIGSQSGAAVLTGGSERIAGCQSLAAVPDPDDWSYCRSVEFEAQWRQLRESSASQFLAVVTPRFLLRLPFGKKFSRTESFDFEELPGKESHGFYLWANGAWLATLLLAQSYSEFRWSFMPGNLQKISRLPIHVFTNSDGDSEVTPCAEVNMTDKAAFRLRETGLTVVRTVFQQDTVVIPEFDSVHSSNIVLQGPWSQ